MYNYYGKIGYKNHTPVASNTTQIVTFISRYHSNSCPINPAPCPSPTAAESEYQEFLYKKQQLQSAYDSQQAVLDGLIVEMEKYTSLLDSITADKTEAKELVDSLPQQIRDLETKLSKIAETKKLFSVAREV